MSYCTVTNVQELIPTAIWNKDSSTNPSADTVTNEYIPAIDAEIDARLAVLYETPITGPISLALLEGISARMTAIRVWGIAFTGQTGDTSHPKDWDEGGRKLLEAIVAGRASLSDATGLGDTAIGEAGQPSMTMRTIAADPLQDTEMTQAFPPGQVF